MSSKMAEATSRENPKKFIILVLNILQTVRMNLESFKVTFSLLRVSMLFAAKC